MDETKCAIVLLGPPGGGKTTLGRSLAARARMTVIETGNLLEGEIRRDSPLGRQIKPYKAAGDLVPVELVRQVISSVLEGVDARIILFDGFPRSIGQIEILRQLLKEQHLELCGVIILTLDLQDSIKRISGRRICPNCGALYNIHLQPPKQAGICDRCGGKLVQRPDDRMEVVRERFRSYERDTLPVIDFFRREFGTVTWEESAAPAPEEVLNHVWRRLEKVIKGMTGGSENHTGQNTGSVHRPPPNRSGSDP
jgi:adenylate kinase